MPDGKEHRLCHSAQRRKHLILVGFTRTTLAYGCDPAHYFTRAAEKPASAV
jgi:hypothetical protein